MKLRFYTEEKEYWSWNSRYDQWEKHVIVNVKNQLQYYCNVEHAWKAVDMVTKTITAKEPPK